MNNVVYYPQIKLDIDYLTKLVYTSKPIDGRPNHHRYVIDDEYMSSIRDKYTFLSPIYNVYVMNNGLPLHIDAGRSCTLNIPLVNTEYSTTIVYENIEKPTVYDSSKVINEYTDRDNCTEIYRFTLDRPTLFNTTYPHEVVVDDNVERISISWSIKEHITFQQAIMLFNECEQGYQ